MALYHTDLHRFLAASLALHMLGFILLYARPRPANPRQEAIAVSLLPAPPMTERPTSTASESAAPAPPPRPPAAVARKDSTTREASPAREVSPRRPAGPAAHPREASTPQGYRDEQPAPLPAPPEPVPLAPSERNTIVADRELPTMRDLLPSATWAASGSRRSAPISLNTRDPVYVSYFDKIKQSIELQWEYPEVALRYGLQGRLSLEFAIATDGQLERLRILRSSGSQVLDDEAVRAIKAAAPFPPIPPWIKANPLSISASMEYHDNRLNYQPGR
ncbi:MAG TPA: energy transducer TonB [Verrucomicrobiae bacterium]|nr:energy transducer TonB [Verrucomicrobiae bacterium]